MKLNNCNPAILAKKKFYQLKCLAMVSLVDDYKLREMFFFFKENCGLNGATPIFLKP